MFGSGFSGSCTYLLGFNFVFVRLVLVCLKGSGIMCFPGRGLREQLPEGSCCSVGMYAKFAIGAASLRTGGGCPWSGYILNEQVVVALQLPHN